MGFFRWLSGLCLAVAAAALAVGGAVVAPRPLSGLAVPAGLPCTALADVAALGAPGRSSASAGAVASVGTVFGARGEVEGRLLSITPARQPARTIPLAAESFVSPPVADVVVYGQTATGAASVLRAVDLVSGCEFALPTVAGVVRGAIVDGAMTALYVHSVGEADRADQGVRRIDLASGSVTTVLDAVAAQQPFGTTYATLLRWSQDGRELVVQSCGWLLCRTRTYHTVTGAVQTYTDRPHGELIGLTAQALYAFDGCDSWPCPVLAIDRTTGEAFELAAEAYRAQLATASDGRSFITIDTPAGTTEIFP